MSNLFYTYICSSPGFLEALDVDGEAAGCSEGAPKPRRIDPVSFQPGFTGERSAPGAFSNPTIV